MATDIEKVAAIYANKDTKPPIDESLYSLDPDEYAFFKSQTGISNEDELKAHILAVQARAYEVCVHDFIGNQHDLTDTLFRSTDILVSDAFHLLSTIASNDFAC